MLDRFLNYLGRLEENSHLHFSFNNSYSLASQLMAILPCWSTVDSSSFTSSDTFTPINTAQKKTQTEINTWRWWQFRQVTILRINFFFIGYVVVNLKKLLISWMMVSLNQFQAAVIRFRIV